MPEPTRTFRSAEEALKFYIRDYESEDYPSNDASEGIRMGENLAISFTRYLRAARGRPLGSSHVHKNVSPAQSVAILSVGSCLPR
jgi:hypothetical protein